MPAINQTAISVLYYWRIVAAWLDPHSVINSRA
jgi:hypothetical protein